MNVLTLRLVAVAAALLLASCASGRLREERLKEFWSLQDDSFEQQNPVEVCPVHNLTTIECLVPVADGMCVEPGRSYLKSLTRDFPYSFWSVRSCSCVSFGTVHVIRRVCTACRAAERRWLAKHGYMVDDEVRCP